MTQSQLGRRRFLGTAAGAALAAAAAAPTIPSTASAAPRRRTPTVPATFRWLGTSGWRIDIGAKTVLDRPATVVPVHWDNFETPLSNPPATTPNDQKRLDTFLTAIRKTAPRTKILLPEYLTPYTFA